MKTVELQFIELVKRTVHQDYTDDGYFQEADWEAIFNLAHKNKMAAIIYDVASKQTSFSGEFAKVWDRYRFRTFVFQKGHEHLIFTLLGQLEEANIKYAVFKGPVLAALYPNPGYRVSSDVDILVKEEDRLRVNDMIVALGYDRKTRNEKANVWVYIHPEKGYEIELHVSIYEDYEGQKIDTLRTAGIEKEENWTQVDVGGRTIPTLGINEQLVYQIFHMIKHFVLEGANVRFFTDILLYIEYYKEQISSEYFWDWMDRLNYTRFCENFFQIGKEIFDIEIFLMEGHKSTASQDALNAMLIDFIYVGDEQEKKEHGWQLLQAMRPYLVGERETVNKSKFVRNMNYLFPPANQIDFQYYEYARGKNYLLPIVWIHRMINKVKRTKASDKATYSGVEQVEVVDNKLELLAGVGLLDEE